MLKLFLLFALLPILIAGYNDEYTGYNGQGDGRNQMEWWKTTDYNEYHNGHPQTTPFPQCLLSGSKSNYFKSSNIQKMFDNALREVEESAAKEQRENYKKKNHDVVDYSSNRYSYDPNEQSRSAASAAIQMTKIIMDKFACNLTGTDSQNLEAFLGNFVKPGVLCTSRQNISCDAASLMFRTNDGRCNNLQRPFDGSAQTAFGRLKSAAYDDGISEPHRKSRRGGLLPACRKISLALGSKPIFNREYNNLFVSFGQFIGHDITLSVPVSDTYSTPITSCTCDAKYDWNKCTVIDIQPDDPYLRWQKCMAFPATAQAFKNELCSLGAKQQLNGNTAFIDLSNVYGSSIAMGYMVRGPNGTLKTTRKPYFKYELPPAQREGRSCIDATKDCKCFAGGDSRIGINLLFTGVQAMFTRAHNIAARGLLKSLPNENDDNLYDLAKEGTIGYFQKIVYEEWLPILFGPDAYRDYFQTANANGRTQYNPNVQPVAYNEVVTAALRLHTLVRDLFTRCTRDAKRIDQLWLHDILQKVKYACDVKNNGIDSLLCGALYDYGFQFDGNFAHQLRHRLFESSDEYGLWRNDLVAINICRGREHGIDGYNAYREYCGFFKAYYFEDFGDMINYEGIQLLKKIYKHVDDVDLFVGLNLEDPVKGGLIGPTSACLLAKQFQVLKDGDRFFYSHAKPSTAAPGVTIGSNDVFFGAIKTYPFYCFICQTVDIDQVQLHPFRAPSDTNPLQDCSKCQPIETTILKFESANPGATS